MGIYEERLDQETQRQEAADLGEDLALPVEWPEEGSEGLTEVPEEPLDFSSPVMQDLQGLLYLGRLEDSFELYGHRFVIQTLTVGEEIRVNQLVDEFKDSNQNAQGRAYAAAVVAGAIQTVDGRKIAQALGPADEEGLLREKYRAVCRWYWPVVELLYKHVAQLERRQLEALDELKKNRDTAS